MMKYRFIVACTLLLFVIVLQLLLNIDSPLFATYGHYDSSVFFMCGKAMMNGMVPYDEFADSKGLLLWLVFGIGYRIDHGSYVGVMCMSVLSYWVALLIAYKTARLYSASRTRSVLCAMAMAVPYFYWNFYTETKAEQFCAPFVAWMLYVLLRSMRGRVSGWAVAGVGASLVAVAMMKWSVAVMMLSLVASIGWWAWRKQWMKGYVFSLVAGAVLAFVPFAVFLTATSSWDDMWREYFVNTMNSVSVPLGETIATYAHELLGVIATKKVVYLVYTLPLLLLWRHKEWFGTLLPWLSAICFMALSARHDNFGHYISATAAFAIALPVAIEHLCRQSRWRGRCAVAALCLSLVYIVWGKWHYSDTVFYKATRQEQFDDINRQIAAMGEHPTVLNMGQDWGFGMERTLPACRYWIAQMGRSEQMWHEQLQCFRSGEADIVVLYENTKEYEADLLQMGYAVFAEFNGARLYRKP